MFQKQIDYLRVPLSDRFYRSIASVAYIPVEAEADGNAVGIISKPHPLHDTADPDAYRFKFIVFRHWISYFPPRAAQVRIEIDPDFIS